MTLLAQQIYFSEMYSNKVRELEEVQLKLSDETTERNNLEGLLTEQREKMQLMDDVLAQKDVQLESVQKRAQQELQITQKEVAKLAARNQELESTNAELRHMIDDLINAFALQVTATK